MFLLITTTIWMEKPFRTISIHLMFLLIGIQRFLLCQLQYFNTSHVSINLMAALIMWETFGNFNTSHVSINL